MSTEIMGPGTGEVGIERRAALGRLGRIALAGAGWLGGSRLGGFRGAHAQEIPPGLPPGLALPSVVLVSMGGTIASKGDVRLNLTNYGGKGNRVAPQEWIDALPDLRLVARVTPDDQRPPEDPAGGAGGGMTLAHIREVAGKVQAWCDRPDVHGVVVTHGTNTMAETAWFMNLVLNTRKPVAFVGSQRPWTGLSGDGPLNLFNAVRVAACGEAAGKGVLHVMNQNINTARDVMKTSAYRVEAFRSPDLGVIGVADPDRVVFHTEPLRRHTHRSEFHLAGLPAGLPSVEILYGYTDAPGYLVDAMVANGAKGLVIDGTGAGALAGGQGEAVKKAQAAGVIVVATTRTRSGRVQDTKRRREANIVPGDNLQPEKARLLLQLALAKGADLTGVKRIFDEY
jgi:L-asparaginase type II